MDVRTIDYSELKNSVDTVDIVIGGPPCQGFSNANRQHTTIISMNNRLVKEYVRAICELQPKAFVMENVAMLKSQVHRFMLDENDMNDPRIMELNLSEDEIIILPAKSLFEEAMDYIKGLNGICEDAWANDFYRIINILYRYRINRAKFDATLVKYQKKISTKLDFLISESSNGSASILQSETVKMASVLRKYMLDKQEFDAAITAIERPLLMQRALLKINELHENDIHVFDYRQTQDGIVADVKSYAVRDYIKAILENDPYNYTLTENTLNALDYGAPQKRERFIIVGTSNHCALSFEKPSALFNEKNQRTVRDAIIDIRDIEPSQSINSGYKELLPYPQASELAKELRGKLLYNHIVTSSRAYTLERFKALSEGQNFHDLDPELKSTYSDSGRTQNTIYMRLKYDEPCGTVVNVRKSMWIHPELNRAISIREAARLQTFPDSFIFEGTKDSQYQQIGNAVPPFLAKAIANNVISVLDASPED